MHVRRIQPQTVTASLISPKLRYAGQIRRHLRILGIPLRDAVGSRLSEPRLLGGIAAKGMLGPRHAKRQIQNDAQMALVRAGDQVLEGLEIAEILIHLEVILWAVSGGQVFAEWFGVVRHNGIKQNRRHAEGFDIVQLLNDAGQVAAPVSALIARLVLAIAARHEVVRGVAVAELLNDDDIDNLVPPFKSSATA